MNIDATYQDAMDSDEPIEDVDDKTGDHGYPAHDILLGNDVLIVENLCNLNKIGPVRGLYSFLPLKLKDSDGSPIRAVYLQGVEE